MEKRILTDRFALRFGTTMHGILFTDSFFAYRYFNSELADFREELSKLAYSLMHNTDVAQPKSPPKGQQQARRASPNSGCISSYSSDGAEHVLVKMKAMPFFQGGKDGRERCVVCNKKTLWCYNDCSDAPHALVPLCPMQSNKHGWITAHMCYEKHVAQPTWMPKGRIPTGVKRRRGGYHDAAIEQASQCDVESVGQ